MNSQKLLTGRRSAGPFLGDDARDDSGGAHWIWLGGHLQSEGIHPVFCDDFGGHLHRRRHLDDRPFAKIA